MRKIGLYLALIFVITLLSGCVFSSVDEMYRLPKRSEEYKALQQVLDQAMMHLSYCAPVSGQQRQTVQSVDLDGDNETEYIIYAKGDAELPLRMLIFDKKGNEYQHIDTNRCNGTAFDQVEYIQMDDMPGMEIVVGRQVSDQLLRSLSVYTFKDGQSEQLMSANYQRFLGVNLNDDTQSELMVMRPGLTEIDRGVVELYSIRDGNVERSVEVNMSEPIDRLKRIVVGRLYDDIPAVFVASAIGDSALITDVYALIDGTLTNVTFSNESGTSVKTLRNYYVYADDIDDDGIVELPHLIEMQVPDQSHVRSGHNVIRWYAMTASGGEVDKSYTYHNFEGGWYMELNNLWAARTFVLRQGNQCDFYVWNEPGTAYVKLMSVYTLTGQDRAQQAVADGRFVIYEGETVVYAASVSADAASYDLTDKTLPGCFRLIRQDWNSGEM